MILFPSVDILNGRAIRLLYGDRNRVTDYGDPLEVVKRYIDAGAKHLHVVDLNGAFDGTEENDETIEKIAELPIKKQLGGGIRTEARARKVLNEIGFDRIVLGSACVTDPELVARLTREFGNRIVGCLDSKDGKVVVKGWTEQSLYTPFELAESLKRTGITDLVFTDVSRDGAMVGVNAELTAQLQNQTGMNLIASGGVKDMRDLESLREKGVYGAILGRSLYNGSINLKEALVYAHETDYSLS